MPMCMTTRSRWGRRWRHYTIFSIVPLLVVIISVSGLIAGPDAIRGKSVRALPPAGPVRIRPRRSRTSWAPRTRAGMAACHAAGHHHTGAGRFGDFFWCVVACSTACGRSKPKPRNSAVGFLLARPPVPFPPFALGLGFLMVVSFVMNAVICGVSLAQPRPGAARAEHRSAGGLSTGLSIVVSSFVFACLFKYLPDVPDRLGAGTCCRRRCSPPD